MRLGALPRSSRRRDQIGRSEVLMRIVAKRLVAGALAETKKNFSGLLSNVANRTESRSGMRRITKGLSLAPAACAPEIGLAGFDVDHDRLEGSDFRLAHIPTFPLELGEPLLISNCTRWRRP